MGSLRASTAGCELAAVSTTPTSNNRDGKGEKKCKDNFSEPMLIQNIKTMATRGVASNGCSCLKLSLGEVLVVVGLLMEVLASPWPLATIPLPGQPQQHTPQGVCLLCPPSFSLPFPIPGLDFYSTMQVPTHTILADKRPLSSVRLKYKTPPRHKTRSPVWKGSSF